MRSEGEWEAEVEGHDWEYLLNAMRLASKDHVIASIVQALGTLTMIAALIWGAGVVFNHTPEQAVAAFGPRYAVLGHHH